MLMIMQGKDLVDRNGKGVLDYGEYFALSHHYTGWQMMNISTGPFRTLIKMGTAILPEKFQEALKENGPADSIDIANDILQVDADKLNQISVLLREMSFSPHLLWIYFLNFSRMDG